MGRPPEQYWETSLKLARLALEEKSTRAALALVRAITDAYRMADGCHDKLAKRGPEKLPDDTFNDWQNFLGMLYKDAWQVYPKYTLSAKPGAAGLQTIFKAISDAAKTAMLKLQDMNMDTRKASTRMRSDVLEALSKLLIALEAAKNNLEQQPKVHTADELQQESVSEAAAYVPLVGRIAAGKPIIADEVIEDILPLPRQVVGEGTLFLLRVAGNSMINAAIADGDLVVVRQQHVAENGEIVAVIIDGEVTVKKFKLLDNNHVALMPENPAYEPISGDEATILGKVVAVLRQVLYRVGSRVPANTISCLYTVQPIMRLHGLK